MKNCSNKEALCTATLVRNGTYSRISDRKRLVRWRCPKCGKSYSNAAQNPCFNQKKRQLNGIIFNLINSNTSFRRIARILKISRLTVIRKKDFLSSLNLKKHELYLKSLSQNQLSDIQIDEMETHIHTKCKPVSIAIAVSAHSRKILAFEVSTFRPKHPALAKKSRKKYGFRADTRTEGFETLLLKIAHVVHPLATLTSDEKSIYGPRIKKILPGRTHICVKSRKAIIAGQGELKEGGYDPLFSLNHTCAMIRANMNRLNRRTWCTSKTIAGLIAHLNLYMHYHNSVLTPA